jgi:O-antigen/teichoic acid export membrane protein
MRRLQTGRHEVKQSKFALALGTTWMTLAFGARIVFQTGYFILIARALGVSDFGALAATVALVSLFAPFATWGSGNLLVMDVAREPRSFPVALGNALITLAVSGTALLAVALVAGAVLLPQVPLAAVLLLGIADLGFARVVDVAGQCFQAFDRIPSLAWISALVPALRCAVAVAFVALSTSGSLVTWTALYLGATVIAAVIALWSVSRRLGRPTPIRALLGRRLRLGGYFAVSASATTIYADVDKVLLARLSTLDATGIYAAAYRAASVAYAPIMALLTVTYASFFRAGKAGIRGSSAYARELLVPAAAYGAVAGLGIFVLAPLAPVVLGNEFGETVEALRWLAPLPLLAAFTYLPADALTGADAQGLRTRLQLGAAALNIILSAMLIPAYSWRGAAWATLVTLALLSLALWLAVAHLQRGPKGSRMPPLGETG